MHALAHAAASPSPSIPTSRRRVGQALAGVATLFLLVDGGMKLLAAQPVLDAAPSLGFAASTMPGIGLLLLACLTLYVVPRTAPLGAVLLTGFLGGAVATHVRVGNPLLSHVLFPVYLGAMLWVGLWLRDARLRALLAPPARR